MKILITGASGLIGRSLQESLSAKGFELLLAGRKVPASTTEIKWDVEHGFADPKQIEGTDVIVHLAGESVSGFRWTEQKKKAIRDSRVLGTRSVVSNIAGMAKKPKLFISGSAEGYYGDRGDELLTEDSPHGNNFLADVCGEWEAESLRAEEFGVRTVLLRTGIVLSKEGGALAAMLTPFKLGLGGVVGSGRQWMSWISLDDEIRIINFILENEQIRGPVNLVAPNPVTNREFAKTLGEVLSRPTILPLPKFAINLVLGEMGDALLLHSTRVMPKKLQKAGYEFKFPNLKEALQNALK